MIRFGLALLSTAIVFPLLHSTVRADAGTDFFEKKVRPVLVEHCYSCHSTEAKKDRGGLKVDTREALLKGGDTGPSIVPGKAKESLLVKAMHYADPDLKMPPKRKLPAHVIADLEKWIDQGVPDPRTSAKLAGNGKGPSAEEGKKWWAFQPLRTTQVPKVKNEAWPKSDLDRFLLAKLEQKNLTPAKDADKVALLRRTYYALVGLPPTVEQIDAFVKDTSPEAFANVVDRLLASPHFGERWGRHWLDVARYADSTGGGRSMLFKDAWRYRDYVIESVNSDKPFDQFIFEQIAGDLLDWRTPVERRQNLIATAFLLLGPTNYERQDKPILEMDIIDEQLETIGKAFLGMTIGCARCHDHKFDPISTKEYYGLAGIFKSSKFIVHSNVSKWAEMPLPMPDQSEVVVRKHEAAVAALTAEISKLKSSEGKDVKAGDGVAMKGAIDPSVLPGIVIDDAQAIKVGNWKPSVYTGNFIGKGYLYDDRSQKGEKTLTFAPDFPKKGVYEVRLAYLGDANRSSKVSVRVFHADGDETITVNQKLKAPIEGRFLSLGKFRFEKGNQWFVMVSTDGADGHVVADAVQFIPEEILKNAPEVKTPPVAAKSTPKRSLAALEAELKRLTAGGPERDTAMSVSEGDKIDDTHVAIRGNYHNKGEVAKRGFVSVIAPTPKDVPDLQIPIKQSGRKQLAVWLTRPENPLTSRVTVNRIWGHLFGEGIVRSVDNFGKTGETPSNPELLDYLARRLMEQGWSTKKIIREIVLSRAFQMSSDASADGMKTDPDNRLFWRMNRRRLDAEELRDTILHVSGSLELSRGGPSVAKGLGAERDHQFKDTRRSVYTAVLRNKLLDILELFDFANPNVSTSQRPVSNVSTQSLYLMNNPFILDQAKVAATRLSKLNLGDDAAKLEWIYRSAVGRLPTPREREIVSSFLNERAADDPSGWDRVMQAIFGCIDFRYVN